jgi:predicted acyltransferase
MTSSNSIFSQRLLALDVFRGLTIALMFVVNNPGTWSFIYPPLRHAPWQGWTPTDFVFPFFLFAVGVAMWFSFKKYEGKPPSDLYFKIVKRGVLIFLIGLGLTLYLNNLSSYSNLRIMGVLQRIGIAYMIGALICISFGRRTVAVIAAALLFGYWALVYYLSDPTFPYGFHDGYKYFGIEDNVVTRFDHWFLGASHLYKGYDGIPFDPEGILSTIPAVATVILGYFTGVLIDGKSDRAELVKVMGLFGVVGLGLGWLWNMGFPINKPIWSSSYVVFMAGWCLVIIAALIWLIDIKGYRGWTKPFIVLGMNSLLAFVVAGAYVKTAAKVKFNSSYEMETIVSSTNPQDTLRQPKRIGLMQKMYEDVFSPITTPPELLGDYKAKRLTATNRPEAFREFSERQQLSSLIAALFHALLFWAILWVFYKFNIFLKV